jgi:hypothetical protein
MRRRATRWSRYGANERWSTGSTNRSIGSSSSSDPRTASRTSRRTAGAARSASSNAAEPKCVSALVGRISAAFSRSRAAGGVRRSVHGAAVHFALRGYERRRPALHAGQRARHDSVAVHPPPLAGRTGYDDSGPGGARSGSRRRNWCTTPMSSIVQTVRSGAAATTRAEWGNITEPRYAPAMS